MERFHTPCLRSEDVFFKFKFNGRGYGGIFIVWDESEFNNVSALKKRLVVVRISRSGLQTYISEELSNLRLRGVMW